MGARDQDIPGQGCSFLEDKKRPGIFSPPEKSPKQYGAPERETELRSRREGVGQDKDLASGAQHQFRIGRRQSLTPRGR